MTHCREKHYIPTELVAIKLESTSPLASKWLKIKLQYCCKVYVFISGFPDFHYHVHFCSCNSKGQTEYE